MKDQMTAEQQVEIKELIFKLNCNLSLVYLKKGSAKEAIKYAKFAIEIDPTSCKAQFRAYKAYRMNNDLDSAKTHLREAVNADPNNMEARREYKELCDTKSKKEKEWYSKMSGFFNSDKMRKLEVSDAVDKELTSKIKRKHYSCMEGIENQEPKE